MTFTGSPVAKYSNASFASLSWNFFEINGFKFTLPFSNSESATGYKLQYLLASEQVTPELQ
eukprot:809793-Amphidinium_carterae.1